MSNFWHQFTKPILALAPMCGVTDLPFRLICKRYGADLVYSEMIMVQSLARQNPSALRLAEISDEERPVIIQLGGREPEHFRTSARMVREIGANGIDINFGCPAKKIAGNGSGVAILRDLQLAHDIIEATLEGAGDLPVSIKTRTSIKLPGQNSSNSSLDLLEFIKDLPISAVMIHGRSFESPWSESVDYDYIKQVKQIFPGIVLANGGIYEPEQAREVLNHTGADGIGIGHGVYGRPWIFNEIRQYLETGAYDQKTWSDKKIIALEHLRLTEELKGQYGLTEFKKQLLWYLKGQPGASVYREQLSRLNDLSDFEQVINNFPSN